MMEASGVKCLINVVEEMKIKDLPSLPTAIRTVTEPAFHPHTKPARQPLSPGIPGTVEQHIQLTVNDWSEKMQGVGHISYQHLTIKYNVPKTMLYKHNTGYTYKGGVKPKSLPNDS